MSGTAILYDRPMPYRCPVLRMDYDGPMECPVLSSARPSNISPVSSTDVDEIYAMSGTDIHNEDCPMLCPVLNIHD
eukprot:3597879-Rhodomonas_salina.1